jgi:lipopolysaccharide export system protein LptA
MNPIARYLFALSAMIVAYTAYARMAVPFLEGPQNVIRKQQVALDDSGNSDVLDKSHLPSLVPNNAWELGSCKTLLTPQGTVYFEEFEPIDDQGNYRLVPFTIVLNDPVNKIHNHTQVENTNQKKPTPIVLRAIEGARLKFSKPLTARGSQDDIEMQSAQLDGQVTVFRPANIANDEDELRVVTRNIQVTHSQIFTLSDVHFSFGPHHGSGRNLSIKLAHKPAEDSPAKSFSSIEGVEQLELAYVSELVLQPADANSFSPPEGSPDANADTASSQPLTLSNQKTPLRLSCDGPFVFRMGEKKAWFRDNVVVTQLDQFRDNLHCESLQIDFQKDGSQTTSVKNLIAIGSRDKPATIVSNSQQTMVVGEELDFDVTNSVVKATGSRPVSIQNPKFAFEAPNLEYRLTENGKLGPLFASGPGVLKGVSDDSKRSFQVHWQRELTTIDYDPERVEINIDGDASVKFDAMNQIAADSIRFLVWQIPAVDSTIKNPKWQYLPSKLITTDDVRIQTEKLNGAAKTFVANWPRPTPEQLGTLPHTVSYRPMPQRLSNPYSREQPLEEVYPLPTFDAAGNVVKSRVMTFSGDEVIANVAGDMDNLRIRDLVVNGSLELESNTTERRPFVISGDSMKLVPQAEELYRVTITGDDERPAKFKTNGFDLVGTNLQLDQSANTIWVQGAGELTIDGQKQELQQNQTNQKLSGLEKVKINWGGGMVFDGSRIYFENAIEVFANRRTNAQGQRSTTKTNSEALTIELTESIRFEKLADSGSATDIESQHRNETQIHRMVFVNHVDQNQRAFRLASHQPDDLGSNKVIGLQNATFDANGNVVALQKLFVPMATVDAVSGDIATSGPGTALTYQYSKDSNKVTGFSQNNPANNTKKSELSCVHVKFDGQLVGNSEKGTMEISRNTRSAWANVDRIDQTLDPDRPDQLPMGAAVLRSDRLKFAQWTPRNSEPRLEMEAEGNTSIRSQLFEAVADRLTYADDTDMMVLEGNAPALAKLTYRKTPKSTAQTMLAGKVMYRLSDGSADGIDIRSVEANISGSKK